MHLRGVTMELSATHKTARVLAPAMAECLSGLMAAEEEEAGVIILHHRHKTKETPSLSSGWGFAYKGVFQTEHAPSKRYGRAKSSPQL